MGNFSDLSDTRNTGLECVGMGLTERGGGEGREGRGGGGYCLERGG